VIEAMDTTEATSFILFFGIVLIIAYVIYSIKKEYEKMQANNS